MSAACSGFRKFFQHQSSLEDLLADDMIRSMMQADGVSPTSIRTLFFEVERTRPGTARPTKHRLRILCRRALNRLLPCGFPPGPDGLYLQDSLLVVSVAVAWLALGRL